MASALPVLACSPSALGPGPSTSTDAGESSTDDGTAGPATSEGDASESDGAPATSGEASSGTSGEPMDTTDTGAPMRTCDREPASIEGVQHDGEYNYAVSFPIRLGFDDDLYATTQSIVWASPDAGAQHEFVADGGWDGCGAARFYPPALGENMAGIGQVLGLRDVVDSPTLAIRYCISAGATFPELSSGAKPVILWRADPSTDTQVHDDAVGARPMVISRPDPLGRGITYGLCDGTVCTYVGGDFWPDGSDTWVLAADGWSCIELDFDLAGDAMQMYVTTEDGRFDDTPYLSATFRDEASGPGGVFSAIDIVGGYFAQSVSDPDNYYTIDDLVIDTEHIGPPPGFAP